MERIVEIYEKYNKENMVEPEIPKLYIAQIGEKANSLATILVKELREKGINVQKDITEKSIKAQFKYADKINSKYVLTIGEDEINNNRAKLKNMKTGEEKEIELNVEDILKNIN